MCNKVLSQAHIVYIFKHTYIHIVSPFLLAFPPPFFVPPPSSHTHGCTSIYKVLVLANCVHSPAKRTFFFFSLIDIRTHCTCTCMYTRSFFFFFAFFLLVSYYLVVSLVSQPRISCLFVCFSNGHFSLYKGAVVFVLVIVTYFYYNYFLCSRRY